MNDLSYKIISALPYGDDFRFVDEITYVDEDRIVGNYTFRADAAFYDSHYVHYPVTPGVLLLECMGQIGLVCHLVFLEKIYEIGGPVSPVLSSVESNFLKSVGRGETVFVESEKIYYRAGVLKSKLCLRDLSGEVCLQSIAQLKILRNE